MSTMRRDYEGPVFGISLTLLCERSGAEVPIILGDILRWLAAHALAQPDVFAEAPKCSATGQLKSFIDSGVPLVELVDGTRPAVVGSLLKRWLEELPDPLLNWDQQVELLSACKDEGCIEARITSLNDAVALVDFVALGTLKPLLLFLQQYCFRQRRFDQQLLQVAVAFAPILFPAALAAGPAELRLAEETVATLVSNALHVFNPTLAANVPVVTPQALCEAAAEIMDMQELPQQAGETTSFECAETLNGACGQPPDRDSSAAMQGQPRALLEEQPDPDQPADGTYEPYLQDVPFLSSFNDMVDSCVAAALFDPFEGCPSDHDVAGWGIDDDCGSMTSSCSHTHLSSGGAASSGGASSCSIASVVLASQGDPCLMPHHHHHHHQEHHHHSHGSSKPASHAGYPPSAREVAHVDVPYSPRAVLVTPLGVVEEDRLRGMKAAEVSCNNAPGSAKSGHLPASGKAVASAHVSAAALAELAQLEVSEGSVFCIISAQPGATPAFVNGSSVGGAVVGVRKASVGPQDPVVVNHIQQGHQPATTGASDVTSGQLDSCPNARSATARRPTEGGAAAGHAQGHAHTYGPSQEQLGVASRLLGLHQVVGSGETRQRRMAMGGGDNLATASPQQQQPRVQHHAQQQLPHAPGGGGSVGSAVAALYQHLPQLRSRLNSSGSSSGGGAGSGSSSGGSSGGGAASSQSTDRLPPTAGTSSAAITGSGYLADLGVAGHLRVTLTSGLTLAVRELTTPEAMAHRVPIRSMTAAAMQSEKERLKRQLKDLAAAYESHSGRPLTQALKEPLRPVYVRYHKIKALLSSGRGMQTAGTAGSGAVVSAGRPQQRSSSSCNMSAASARPGVVV